MVYKLYEMLAYAYGLPIHHFTQYLSRGIHLNGPTGANLGIDCPNPMGDMLGRIHEKGFNEDQDGLKGLKITGLHTDVNPGSIHGPSSVPGLYLWNVAGKRIKPSLGKGEFLFQVAEQLAARTAYDLKAGRHMVYIPYEELKRIQQGHQPGTSIWRISSTLFITDDRESPMMPHEIFLKEKTKKERIDFLDMHPRLEGTAGEYLLWKLGVIGFNKA